MACEISAINDRNIFGVERLQRLRIVPIQEMAVKPFERSHGPYCVARSFDQSPGRDVTKIIRREICQQRHSDIGRRCSMSDDGFGIFLIVIGRKPVIFGTNKFLEKQPRLPCGSMKKKDLKIEKEEGDIISFKEGTYNKLTGIAKYSSRELPYYMQKLTKLHKASTKEPLFFLNVFFAISLLFFVVSSFWMFLPKTTIFKKGLYFTLAGIILTIILLIL